MLIQVIVASVRKARIGDQIAEWVLNILKHKVALKQKTDFTVELIDLLEWHLPMDDEPYLPKTGNYTQEHTKAFSKKIAAAKAYVFVTPKYNGSYPAALKNALDHLYNEWRDKPATIVAYGHKNLEDVVSQLQAVLNKLHLKCTKSFASVILNEELYIKADNKAGFKLELTKFEESLTLALNELLNLLKIKVNTGEN